MHNFSLILIEYLSENDRNELGYKAIKEQSKYFQTYKAKNPKELFKVLDNLTSDDKPLILTFLSHGNPRGILFNLVDSLVRWDELYQHVNNIRTKNPIILNLIGICNSIKIVDYSNVQRSRIDKMWVSTNSVDSLDKALKASLWNNFNFFIGLLEEYEREVYKEIIKS